MLHQGQYPVIFLTFKNCKASNIEQCLSQICGVLIKCYLEDKPLIYHALTQEEKQFYDKITQEQGTHRDWENALSFLMQLHKKQTDKRVFVLLDEYDTTIHA